MITMPSKVIPHLISCSGAETYTPAAAVLGITYFWITNARLHEIYQPLSCFACLLHLIASLNACMIHWCPQELILHSIEGREGCVWICSSHRQVMRRKIHRW
ncbi:hypothetical protein O6H91_04G041700 [Diphasiastrum complanatum]|uniref:Uncharacterized protein n=1 Tax=Diphasiastrum complanatum TaxID=34168 RepID=A0ACC2DW47_DIPCM|nr:hypothetical protein O6H91_04G041700 [Diphasiastrum complanatum]